MLGRFGVVKLWPDIKVAEDEVIARIRTTATSLGLDCVVVDHLGRMVEPPYTQMTQDDLDFVIHLHFSTPKAYDIFSFVVLWNPVSFYHDFGYRPMVRNLLSHDDFLSCSAPGADDQLGRLVARDPTRLPAQFTMYHSLSEPVLPPTVGEGRMFYSGINWERLGRGTSRHQEVLDELDLTGTLRIYGPRKMRGVQVWEGYKSYQGSIPFDGATAIHEIHKAGICLALSSGPHKEAGMMSNRLFEGLAAGAVIICDENPFAKKHFGDTLLYVDARDEPSDMVEQILAHVDWVRRNPEEAVALAARAQAIFTERFRLDLSLRQIYDGFPARRAQLEQLSAPASGPAVEMFMLMPEWDKAVLRQHLRSLRTQRYGACRPVLVVDDFDLAHFGTEIRAAIAGAGVEMPLRGAAFFSRNTQGKAVGRNRLGSVLQAVTDGLPEEALFCAVAPNEALFANHVASLTGALMRDEKAGYAFSGMLLKHKDAKGETFCDTQDSLDLLNASPHLPVGLGRFLFRAGATRDLVAVLLPWLDIKATAGLALHLEGVATDRPTVAMDIQDAFFLRPDLAKAKDGKDAAKLLQEELEAVRDFDREAFDRLNRLHQVPMPPAAPLSLPSPVPAAPQPPETVTVEKVVERVVTERMPDELAPVALYLDRMSSRDRQLLAAQILKSLPLPGFIWKMLRPFRPWR
jgi:hypothetical protein